MSVMEVGQGRWARRWEFTHVKLVDADTTRFGLFDLLSATRQIHLQSPCILEENILHHMTG